MTTSSSESNFKQLILNHYSSLSRQQVLIADYLLEHLREGPFLSVPELSRRANVSEATVVRFARKLGFPGFPHMKMALMEEVKYQLFPEGGDFCGGDDEADSMAAACRQAVENIERTSRDIGSTQFQRAANMLFKADHIFTFGQGVSGHLADLLAYMLSQVGIRISPLSPKYSSPLEQLVSLRITDLLVLFSLPPYSRSTVEVIEEARGKGIKTLVICDRETAPAASIADMALPVKTDNLLFTNSLAALVVLMNALAVEIAIKHGPTGVEAVSRINQILAHDRNLILE